MNNILKDDIRKTVAIALDEDIGCGDITAQLIGKKQQASAKIICRQAAVICGIPWAEEVFQQVDSTVKLNWVVEDGNNIESNQTICLITGLARSILTAERTALNFLQTLSATAGVTKTYVDLILGCNCKILDTRKTIPGLRLAQKYAVRIGGGTNHRIGLYDGVLIKENHIRSTGSIKNALNIARKQNHDSVLIEVEVENLEEFKQALAENASRIMLDNFTLEDLNNAVKINQSRARLEASGNITVDNIHKIALTGVDYISLGSLTKHIQAVDLSLLFNLC